MWPNPQETADFLCSAMLNHHMLNHSTCRTVRRFQLFEISFVLTRFDRFSRRIFLLLVLINKVAVTKAKDKNKC